MRDRGEGRGGSPRGTTLVKNRPATLLSGKKTSFRRGRRFSSGRCGQFLGKL